MGVLHAEGAGARTAHAVQATGRLLICSIFLYYALHKVHGYSQRALAELEHFDALTPLFEGLMIVALLYVCSLVIVGIKSRWVALGLAVGAMRNRAGRAS